MNTGTERTSETIAEDTEELTPSIEDLRKNTSLLYNTLYGLTVTAHDGEPDCGWEDALLPVFELAAQGDSSVLALYRATNGNPKKPAPSSTGRG